MFTWGGLWGGGIKDVNPAEPHCMFVFTALVFRPIKGQRKTFEELLEEQLQLEEQRLKTAEQQVAKPVLGQVLYIYRNYHI